MQQHPIGTQSHQQQESPAIQDYEDANEQTRQHAGSVDPIDVITGLTDSQNTKKAVVTMLQSPSPHHQSPGVELTKQFKIKSPKGLNEGRETFDQRESVQGVGEESFKGLEAEASGVVSASGKKLGDGEVLKNKDIGIDVNIQDFIQDAETFLQSGQDIGVTDFREELDSGEYSPENISADLKPSQNQNPQFWSVGASQKIIGSNLLPFPASKKIHKNQFVPKVSEQKRSISTIQKSTQSPRRGAQDQTVGKYRHLPMPNQTFVGSSQIGTIQIIEAKERAVSLTRNFNERKSLPFVTPRNARFFRNRRNTATLQPIGDGRNPTRFRGGSMLHQKDRHLLEARNLGLQKNLQLNGRMPQNNNYSQLEHQYQDHQIQYQQRRINNKKTVNLNVVVEDVHHNSNFDNQTDQTAIDARSNLQRSTYLSGVLQNGSANYDERKPSSVLPFMILAGENQSPVTNKSQHRKSMASEQSQQFGQYHSVAENTVAMVPRIRLEAMEYERVRLKEASKQESQAQVVNASSSINNDLNLRESQKTVLQVLDTREKNHESRKKTLGDAGSGDALSIPQVHALGNLIQATESNEQVKLPLNYRQEEHSFSKTSNLAAMIYQATPQLFSKEQYIIAVAQNCSNSKSSISPHGSPRSLGMRKISAFVSGPARMQSNQMKIQDFQDLAHTDGFGSKATFSPQTDQVQLASFRKDHFPTHNSPPRSNFIQIKTKTPQQEAVSFKQKQRQVQDTTIRWNQNNAFLKEKITYTQIQMPKLLGDNQRKLIEINDSNKQFVKQTESKDTMMATKVIPQSALNGGHANTEFTQSNFRFNGAFSKQQVSKDALPVRTHQVLDNSSSHRENNLKAFSLRTLPQNNTSQQSMKKAVVEQPKEEIKGEQILEAARGQTPQSDTGSPVSPQRLTSKIPSKIPLDNPARSKGGLTLKVMNMSNHSRSAQPQKEANAARPDMTKQPSSTNFQNSQNHCFVVQQQQFGAVKTHSFPIDPSYEQLNAILASGEVINIQDGGSTNRSANTARSGAHAAGSNQAGHDMQHVTRKMLIPKLIGQQGLVKKVSNMSNIGKHQESLYSKKDQESRIFQGVRTSGRQSQRSQAQDKMSEMRKSIDKAFEVFENFAKAGKDMQIDTQNVPPSELDSHRFENQSDFQSWGPTPRSKIEIGGQNLFEFAVGRGPTPESLQPSKPLKLKTYQLPLGLLPEDHKFIAAYRKLNRYFSQSQISQLSNFLTTISQLEINSVWKQTVIQDTIRLQKKALIEESENPTSRAIEGVQNLHPRLQDILLAHISRWQSPSNLDILENIHGTDGDDDHFSQGVDSVGSPSPVQWKPPATAETQFQNPRILHERSDMFPRGHTRVHSGTNQRDKASDNHSQTRQNDSFVLSKGGEHQAELKTIGNSRQGDGADSYIEGLPQSSGGRRHASTLKQHVIKTKVQAKKSSFHRGGEAQKNRGATPSYQASRHFGTHLGFEQRVTPNRDLSLGKKQQLLVQDVIQNLVTGKKLETQQIYHMRQGTSHTYAAKRHLRIDQKHGNTSTGQSRFASTGPGTRKNNRDSNFTPSQADRDTTKTRASYIDSALYQNSMPWPFVQSDTMASLPDEAPQNSRKPLTAIENYRKLEQVMFAGNNFPTTFTNEAIMQSATREDENQPASAGGWSRNDFDHSKRSPTAVDPRTLMQKLSQSPDRKPAAGRQNRQSSIDSPSRRPVWREGSIKSQRSRVSKTSDTSNVIPETCSVIVYHQNADGSNLQNKQYVIKGQKPPQTKTMPQPSPMNFEYGNNAALARMAMGDKSGDDGRQKNRNAQERARIGLSGMQEPSQNVGTKDQKDAKVNLESQGSPLNNIETSMDFSLPKGFDTFEKAPKFSPQAQGQQKDLQVDIQILKDTKRYVQIEYQTNEASLATELQRRISQSGMDSTKLDQSPERSRAENTSASFRANSGMQMRESQMLKSLGSPLLKNQKNLKLTESPGGQVDGKGTQSIGVDEEDFEEMNQLEDQMNELDLKLLPAQTSNEQEAIQDKEEQVVLAPHTEVLVYTNDAGDPNMTSGYHTQDTKEREAETIQNSAQRTVMYSNDASPRGGMKVEIPGKTVSNGPNDPNSAQDYQDQGIRVRPRRNHRKSPETAALQDAGSIVSEPSNSPFTPQRIYESLDDPKQNIRILNQGPQPEGFRVQQGQNPPMKVPRLNLMNLPLQDHLASTGREGNHIQQGFSQLISNSQIPSILTTKRFANSPRARGQGSPFVHLQIGASDAPPVNNTLMAQAPGQFSIYEFERQFQATIKTLKQADEPNKFKKHQGFWQCKSTPRAKVITPKCSENPSKAKAFDPAAQVFTAVGKQLPAAIDNPLQVHQTRRMIQQIKRPRLLRENPDNLSKEVNRVKICATQVEAGAKTPQTEPADFIRPLQRPTKAGSRAKEGDIQVAGKSKKINHSLIEAIRQNGDTGNTPAWRPQAYEVTLPDDRGSYDENNTPQEPSVEYSQAALFNLQPMGTLLKQASVETNQLSSRKKVNLVSVPRSKDSEGELKLKPMGDQDYVDSARTKYRVDVKQYGPKPDPAAVQEAQIIKLFNQPQSTQKIKALQMEAAATNRVQVTTKVSLNTLDNKVIDRSNSQENDHNTVTHTHDQEISRDIEIANKGAKYNNVEPKEFLTFMEDAQIGI